MNQLKVLVTGATGLVGFHTVKAMLAKGNHVVARVRAGSRTDALEALSCQNAMQIVRGELNDSEALRRDMAGVDVVVHAAGLVDPHATREEIYAVNVEGTRSVMSAAAMASVRHFIHISSLSVITGQNDQYNVGEKAPLVYCGESYADSKVDAEKTVTGWFGKGEMLVTILRPGFIYGPGERAWMPRLMENLRLGKAMLIDGGTKQCNVIYVENLVKAIELSMLNPKADKQVFNLTDGELVTKKTLFDSICDGMGYPRVTKKVPGFIAKAACEVVSMIAPHLPPEKRKNLTRFSRAAFRLAGLNQGFDVSLAEQTLDYKGTNRIPFAEGMRRTLECIKNDSQDVRRNAPVLK
ncbi:MAG: NAD-dependent epimerase/dehydratase family protein [Candidatus Obscuribacterales bacterium]|nr:NAD-dependent epimerase/dehydratase family protein [Candidatus Obscuribacterales bacterium]